MKNCHLSIAFIRLDASEGKSASLHYRRKIPMSAGLWNRFEIWHTSENNVLCDKYLQKSITFDEYWQKWYVNLKVQQE